MHQLLSLTPLCNSTNNNGLGTQKYAVKELRDKYSHCYVFYMLGK